MSKSTNLGVLLVILAIIGFVAIIMPQAKTFGQRSLTVEASTNELNSYNQRINDLSTLQSGGTSFQNVINELDQAMPSSSQIPESLVTIEDIGNSSGITFTNVSLGTVSSTTESGSSSVSTVPITVSFSGSQTNLNTFLGSLYSNVRTADIISQTIDSNNSGNLTVTIELGLVYQGGGS